jgi:hypothetical protein
MKKMQVVLLGWMLTVGLFQTELVGRAAESVSKDLLKPGRDIIPNRTLPRVQPPKTELEFSARPNIQEISRARLFETPLVPIGGEPGAAENGVLAAAVVRTMVTPV